MVTSPAHSKIFILDFGSQYTQVIARRVRELQVYSEIVRFDLAAAEIAKLKANGIILSGGPASVYDKGAPQVDPQIFSLGIPVLGICYGMQLMAHHLGGQVEFSARREYGPGILHVTNGSLLFDGIGDQLDIWNSHGDKVAALPAGFRAAARTENSKFAAIEDPKRELYALQFHPEVSHTPRGKEILQNFVSHLSLRDGLDDGLVHRRGLRAHSRAGRRSKGRARLERRRRFIRHGRAFAQSGRRPAHLHFCEQWTTAFA